MQIRAGFPHGWGAWSVTRRLRKSPAPADTSVVLGGPEKGKLRHLGGSQSDVFNTALLTAMIQSNWMPKGQTEEDHKSQFSAAVVAMCAFKPADEIEGMIAAQAVAMHHASMECSRRAMIPEQPFEITQGYRKAAANMSRTFTELLSALDRKRGKGGQQRVIVEHVNIHAGGQAIVGNLAPGAPTGGGDRGRSSGEPQASHPELAHAPDAGVVLPPLRSQDPERQPVPVAGHGE